MLLGTLAAHPKPILALTDVGVWCWRCSRVVVVVAKYDPGEVPT